VQERHVRCSEQTRVLVLVLVLVILLVIVIDRRVRAKTAGLAETMVIAMFCAWGEFCPQVVVSGTNTELFAHVFGVRTLAEPAYLLGEWTLLNSVIASGTLVDVAGTACIWELLTHDATVSLTYRLLRPIMLRYLIYRPACRCRASTASAKASAALLAPASVKWA